LGVASVVLALAACGSSQPEAKAAAACTPPPLDVVLLASPRINPTPGGEPRPVVVRLYTLKDDARLANASFDAVWHEDKEVLADDVAKMEEVQVYPNSRIDKRIERGADVRHLAAVALVQEPKGRSWHYTFDLPSMCETGCSLCDEDGRPIKEAALSFYLDGPTVDDGVEHLDEFSARSAPKGSLR
jgi:type VI secretion system protein VasD